jgi:hypothetical protein
MARVDDVAERRASAWKSVSPDPVAGSRREPDGRSMGLRLISPKVPSEGRARSPLPDHAGDELEQREFDHFPVRRTRNPAVRPSIAAPAVDLPISISSAHRAPGGPAALSLAFGADTVLASSAFRRVRGDADGLSRGRRGDGRVRARRVTFDIVPRLEIEASRGSDGLGLRMENRFSRQGRLGWSLRRRAQPRHAALRRRRSARRAARPSSQRGPGIPTSRWIGRFRHGRRAARTRAQAPTTRSTPT